MQKINTISFRLVEPNEHIWSVIENSNDSTCYHSNKWFLYLRRIGYNPVLIEVYDEMCTIGYFVGERIWRGVWIIASPFDGIGTYTQGLVFLNEVSSGYRAKIYKALSYWIIHNKIATYFQVDDWQLRVDSEKCILNKDFCHPVLDEEGIQYEMRPTLYLPMKNKTNNDLWSGLHYKSAKYCINKAKKMGLISKIIVNREDIDKFVEIHYAQLKEVCNRKGMDPKPSQSLTRMKAICESLFPDRVLMIYVEGLDEEGQSQIMSSAIFCIDKGQCSYWTGASYQRYQKYCPNELMVWDAISILNERGCGDLNFCGMASYKLKFGTIYAHVPRLIFTKYRIIYYLKDYAKRTYHFCRCIISKFR